MMPDETVSVIVLLDSKLEPRRRWICHQGKHYVVRGDPPEVVEQTWPCSSGLHEGTKIFPGSNKRTFELGTIKLPVSFLR